MTASVTSASGQAAVLEERGAWPARSPWIRTAVEKLPREWFAPERLWRWDGHRYRAVDRAADPAGWAAQLYGDPDRPAITQLTDGRPTSSLSSTGVVVDMLDSLFLEPGHRVLELGTGTGWNAALLASRAGPGHVLSVETDPALAAAAGQRLQEADAEVPVVVGDGTAGWPAGALYDRVIATYAVDTVPWSWVAQTRPGGRIVTPWGHLGHVALTVNKTGSAASGWMQGLGQFMPARSTPAPAPSFTDVRAGSDSDTECSFTRDLAPLEDPWGLGFHLRVVMPELRFRTAWDEDGLNAWLHDGSSWAVLAASGDGRTIATQGGPGRLVEALSEAWDQWTAAKAPTVYDYGMTVADHGATQYVWVHDPSRPVLRQAQRATPEPRPAAG
ncbi:methyltransferase domain-containing protein [Streptomyces candidus]|uniref:Protein-L-isoaspartate O-methyltransferase n=1 Tax=Streptomyces candidus TaxID=67283 RepID=A0A7X0HLS3_9ACTN|nr:methyltransferase domain-containing protein [Streptomyces candidus]MBB6439803.1 protein-L-isoaspartate O-methyltransferase [Streptomyces candidus]GHH57195.1 protein-L-isoaspartate O-methyltransferase [Streptomyces candidus]